jgi:hypothetical protein
MKPEVLREQHVPLPICALQIALGLTGTDALEHSHYTASSIESGKQ